jgi:hypothetical protein
MGGKDIMSTRTTIAQTTSARTRNDQAAGEQSHGGHPETGHREGHREHGSRKPPVTQQEDWETMLRPWILQVEDALEIDDLCDVDRVHEMTGVVASGVQRSMAPISSFLVGIAVGRGASLEDACRVVERVTLERAGAEPGPR